MFENYLNKTSRKILGAINFLCKSNETTTGLDIDIYFSHRTRGIDETLLYLQKRNLIIFVDGAFSSDNETIFLRSVAPTYEGKHYKEFDLSQIKGFVIKSVLVPIVVSVITAVIISILIK